MTISKVILSASICTMFASLAAAQNFVFDYKQPKIGAADIQSEPMPDETYDPAIPLAKLVYMPGFDANSPEMQGWQNDPLTAQLYFYGAIAASGIEYGWWADNFHSIEAARAHVLEWCNMDIPPNEKPCEIVADIYPDDSVVDIIAELSADGNLGYENYLLEDNVKAFAISPNGAWGYAYGYTNLVEATFEALETCNEFAAEETNPTTINSACVLLDRNGELIGE